MTEPEAEKPTKQRNRKKQLYETIVKQMEFYFSNANLSKDRFLSGLIKESDYIDLSIFMKFNKIRALVDKVSTLAKALKYSSLLELSSDSSQVCRKTPAVCKESEELCTIYVERLPADAQHEWLIEIFSQFGKVDYVSIPKYKHNKMIKGFAFVEFDTPESAAKTLAFFDSIGCKLSTKISLEDLWSIASFQKEMKENQAVFGGSQPESNEEENGSKAAEKKRKLKVSPEEAQAKPKKLRKTDAKIESQEARSKAKTAEEEEEEEPPKKKTKLEKKEKKKRPTVEVEASSSPAEKQEESVETCEEEDETSRPESSEKKRRKRKKGHKKSRPDLSEIGLQVLSKTEWKRLRNKYLDLQRKKMQNLKYQLHRAKYSNANYIKPEPDKSIAEKTEEMKCRFEFIPGIIVHFELYDIPREPKKYKSELKAKCQAEYVDYTANSPFGHVRFASSEDARKFAKSDFDGQLRILDGEEEQSYWHKLLEMRESKFMQNKTKQRGRNKLLKKAEKQLGKYIRFEECD